MAFLTATLIYSRIGYSLLYTLMVLDFAISARQYFADFIFVISIGKYEKGH